MSDDFDLAAFIESLKSGSGVRRRVFAHLLDLDRLPGALLAVCAALEPWQQRYITPWLTRTPICPAVDTLGQFARLATRRARRHARDFPSLRARDLRWVSQGNYGGRQHADTRVNGRGWLFEASYDISGPAETREEVTWCAVACGGNWALGIAQASEQAPGLLWEWPVDPLDPTPAMQLG